jgi:hypothetical protein
MANPASSLPPATAFRPRALRAAMAGVPHLWAKNILPLPDFREDTLHEMATRRTGLQDFGDDGFFRTQLRVLLPALEHEARLNALGMVIAQGQLLKVMKERLWAQALFTAHPQIGDIAIAAPLVIVGPMRSGTTRLHRLLACDTAVTALSLYEAMCPVPWPTSHGKARGSSRGSSNSGSSSARAIDPRRTYTKRGLAFINWVNPGNAAVHPTDPDAVDEELGLLEQSASGGQIEAQRRIPAFARYLEQHDQAPAYAHMKRLLQLRTWFRGIDPALPYVLKTPQHMQDLPALLAVFPDARLIFTHRDAVSVVASSASLAWNQMVVQSDHVDPHWIGAEWLGKTLHRADITARARAGLAPGRAIDISFDAMERDWAHEIAHIYRHFDLELQPATRFAMQAWLVRAERTHAHRSHRYAPEDFGLTAGLIRETLGETARALA